MAETGVPVLDDGRAPAPARPAAAPRGRDPGTASGWIAKIVLLGLVDALAITGLLIAWEPGGMGLRRRARRHARRPQRGLPAAALRADEVPAAGALLPRRVRRVPGALHGVRVDDELRHRVRAQRVTGDRPDPEPVDHPHRRVDGLRRHAAPRARWSLRRLRALRHGDRRALPRHDRQPRAARGRARAAGPHDDGAHVRRQRRRPRGRPPRAGGHAARLPDGPLVIRDARPDRGLRDPHLGRPGRRVATDQGLRPVDGDHHRRRDRRRLHRGRGAVRRRGRHELAAPRVHDGRRVLELQRGADRRRVPW